MRSTWRLGRWRGVPILLHWTVLIGLPWFAYQTKSVGGTAISFAAFFVLLVVHELGHAAVATWRRVDVHRIELLFLHGLCVHDQPYDEQDDVLIAGRRRGTARRADRGPRIRHAAGAALGLHAPDDARAASSSDRYQRADHDHQFDTGRAFGRRKSVARHSAASRLGQRDVRGGEPARSIDCASTSARQKDRGEVGANYRGHHRQIEEAEVGRLAMSGRISAPLLLAFRATVAAPRSIGAEATTPPPTSCRARS